MAWKSVCNPRILVPDNHNLYPGSIIQGNTTTGLGLQPNQWTRVSLLNWGGHLDPVANAGHIPPVGAVSISLSGEFILTNSGQCLGIMDTSVSFRAPGMADWMTGSDYVHQCCEATPGNGQRSTMSARVPIKDDAFEVYWRVSHPGAAGFGINLVCEEVLYDGSPV